LKDTVVNYDQHTGKGTGFVFNEPSSKAIYHTVEWAEDTYFDRKPDFGQLVQMAMVQNFTWESSTKEYMKLYKRAKEIVMRRKQQFHLETT
jgi:starch synthase